MLHTHANQNDSTSLCNVSCRPFLKWTGGKQRLLSSLLPLLPKGSRLIEPFVGAGSVWLGADYKSYLINDANPVLSAVWLALQQKPNEFISKAELYFCEEYRSQSSYLDIRERFNSETCMFGRAVMLPYLNRFGFNGLFRVNRLGKLNTPYGYPRKVPNFPSKSFALASLKLQSCLVTSGDYKAAVAQAGPGDVVYCDPPYLVVSGARKNESPYTVSSFGSPEFYELVRICEDAVQRGAAVAISNLDCEQSRRALANWKSYELNVSSTVSGNASGRRVRRELLAVGLPRKFSVCMSLN
jgi:DNA adenine methylase